MGAAHHSPSAKICVIRGSNNTPAEQQPSPLVAEVPSPATPPLLVAVPPPTTTVPSPAGRERARVRARGGAGRTQTRQHPPIPVQTTTRPKRRGASQPICENLRNPRFRQSRAIHFVYCRLNSQCSKHDLPLPLVCPQPIVRTLPTTSYYSFTFLTYMQHHTFLLYFKILVLHLLTKKQYPDYLKPLF